MKKRLLLIIVFSILLLGCSVIETQEPTTLEVPVPDVEYPSEVEEGAVNSEMPVPGKESVEEMVAEVPLGSGCARVFSPTFSSSPHYNGPLFDAHFHMPNLIDFNAIGHGESPGTGYETNSNKDPVLGNDIELSKLLCNFDKETVIGVIGFAIGAEQASEETISRAKSVKDESLGKINLFLMPRMFSIEGLDYIQEKNPNLFKGYGEVGFYTSLYVNTLPDSQEMMDVYAVAGKHNLIVMIHPDARQESMVENAIKKNPDVKFLIHGPEIENSIINIVGKYPNAYYSIDAILIRSPGSPGGLIYTTNNLQELKSSFSQNYERMMNDAVNKWKSKIEKYPDKFMWGTDRAYLWHYDEGVGILLEEFGRDFIAELNPEVQERFAYKNAEALLS